MKRKLERFEENLTFPNMFQVKYEELLQGFEWKGRWKEWFGNDHPIVLEIGCGKGEYTVNLAEQHPDCNYIGIDIKGARMWRGCKTSQEKKLTNVAFIRSYVQVLGHYFDRGEVSKIWITFPDPQPRQARAHKRLTHPRFLLIFNDLLKDGGVIHLKTDNHPLFQYTLEVIAETGNHLVYATDDLYRAGDAPAEATGIQTFYEKMFLEEGKPICYLEFTLQKNFRAGGQI